MLLHSHHPETNQLWLISPQHGYAFLINSGVTAQATTLIESASNPPSQDIPADLYQALATQLVALSKLPAHLDQKLFHFIRSEESLITSPEWLVADDPECHTGSWLVHTSAPFTALFFPDDSATPTHTITPEIHQNHPALENIHHIAPDIYADIPILDH